MNIQFTEPTRAGVKLKAIVSGPTGSGKTEGALALATGLTANGRIGHINSEIDGTAFQIGRYKWEQYDFHPDDRGGYDPRRLEQAIADIQKAKLDCLIVDTLSLFWDGPGGLLDIKAQEDTGGRNKNQFANWGIITKIGKSLMDEIMRADIHILCTLRAERKFREVEDPRNPGKKIVVDTGWKPVFRYKHLYDPHVIWMLNGPEEEREGLGRRHSLWYFKDRIGLERQFPNEHFLTADFGKKIAAHLGSSPAPTTLATDPLHVTIERIEPRQGAFVYYGPGEALVFTTDQGLQKGERIIVREYKANGKLGSVPRYDCKGWEPATEGAK